MLRFRFVLFCLPLFSFSLFAEDRVPDDTAVLRSFQLAPSYFIGNSVNAKTGKRLVDNSEVVAFVQTQKGRVLFSPSGVHIGVACNQESLNATKQTSFQPIEDVLDSSGNRGVVMQVGIPDETMRKRKVLPRLEERAPGVVNFLIGNEANWQTNLSTYRKLVYDHVWKGITLEYLGYQDHIGFQLLVEPFANPKQIHLETGAEKLEITEDGNLSVQLSGAALTLSKPFAYQIINNEKVTVGVYYKIFDKGQFGFVIGRYNRNFPLVIDPELTWSTFLGGTGNRADDIGGDIVVDDAGNSYVVGITRSLSFPTTPGAFDNSLGGSRDVFVSKLNENASELIFSTLIGGQHSEYCKKIWVDSTGQVILVGNTLSIDFPTTENAYDQVFNNSADVFLCKLNSEGNDLLFSTYLGGSGGEYPGSLEVDGDGNIFITGNTFSNNFPTTLDAYDNSPNGGSDLFLSQFNPNASELIYSSYVGGSMDDRGLKLALSGPQNVYVSGYTASTDFPVTQGSYDETFNGGVDLFLIQLNIETSTLEYSSYLGGTENERGPFGFALNDSNQVFLYGYTDSNDFPVTSGVFDNTYNGNGDYFICKVDIPSSSLAFSTYLGGTDEEYDQDSSHDGIGYSELALDSSENMFLVGTTKSTDYPTTLGAYNENHNGGVYDAFVSKLASNGKSLVYSTFLGGTGLDYGNAIDIDLNGNAFITGKTASEDFPVTIGVIGDSFKFSFDVFVTKLDPLGENLVYSTFLGGVNDDSADGRGIERDDMGNLVVVGTANSQEFPITQGAAFSSYSGMDDVFICKINPNNNELIFSTFLGGEGIDEVSSLALDNSRNVYVTGQTYSEDFPTTSDAYDPSFNGLSDAYVAKLNPTGTSLEFSTFLGGGEVDGSSGIGLDVHNNVYVTGFTASTDFPTTLGSFDETHNGRLDAFICKLNSIGTTLLASTFFGGSGVDSIYYQGNHLVLDAFDNVYIAGTTDSLDVPLTNGAFDTTFNGDEDVFVVKMNSDLADLGYATYLGGTLWDFCSNLGIDNTGSLYVFGSTWSDNFPVTVEAFDTSYNGATDCYLTKVAPNGTSLIYSTFIGGSDFDTSRGVSIDAEGNTVLVGDTRSTNFPTTLNAFDDTHNGSSDVFTFCLNQTGRRMFFSTYLGGSGIDVASGIEVDNDGFAYITGYTQSSEFPVSNPTFDDELGEGMDAFVTKFKYCDSLSFLSQPSSTVRCVGDSVLFSIEVLGSGPISHQWKKDGIDISGADTEVFQIDTLELDDFGTYSVVVSNPCGSIQSQDFELRLDSPQILSEQGFQRTCVGEFLRLTVTVAEVPNLTYQWRKDGLDLPGQNQPHLDLDPVVSGDMGHYSCYICNDCSCIESTPFGVDVDGPVVEILPNSVAQGLDNIVLTASVPCSHGPTTVEWENLNTHEVNTENPLEVGVQLHTVQFRATVTDDNAETATAIATILVHENDILDFNGDQCNDLQDLWDIMTFWGQSYPMDPNSDQHIDIRDFLYINIQDPLGCP